MNPGEEKGPQGWERQAQETADAMVPSSHMPLSGEQSLSEGVRNGQRPSVSGRRADGRDGGCAHRELQAHRELLAQRVLQALGD